MADQRLHPEPDGTPRWAEVIDLANIRVQFGLPKFPAARRERRNLTYNAPSIPGESELSTGNADSIWPGR